MKSKLDIKSLFDPRKKVKPDKGEWPYVILGTFLFFGSIFLFVLELDDFGYTTHLNTLLIIFGLIGLALAIFLSIYYGKGTKGVERLRLTLLFLFFVTLIVPVWAHFINRQIPIRSEVKSLEVFENPLYQPNPPLDYIDHAKEEGLPIILVHNKGLIKVLSKKPEHLILKPGDNIELRICKGIFGFEFIDAQYLQ